MELKALYSKVAFPLPTLRHLQQNHSFSSEVIMMQLLQVEEYSVLGNMGTSLVIGSRVKRIILAPVYFSG